VAISPEPKGRARERSIERGSSTDIEERAAMLNFEKSRGERERERERERGN
jgi:hypothetical protein